MTEKLKTIKIIHLFLCAGIIAIYVLMGNLTQPETLKMPVINSASMVYLALPILAFLIGNFLYKSQIKKVTRESSLDQKFMMYQTASIMRWSIIEGLTLVLLFLQPDFIAFGLLMIMYLLFLRPSEDQFKRDFDNTHL